MMENFPANIPERAKQVVLGTPNVEPNSAAIGVS
jgi:hypothetical protein